jgi:hypothetical protein
VAPNALPSEAAWIDNMNRLRQLVLDGDPREFLRWHVVQETMFATFPLWIRKELSFLKSRPDWNSRWQKAIEESPIGHPLPCPFYPNSSGNLIHQAYHLAQFEQRTGVHVSNMGHVFEFGGGYGCMCRLFHELGFRGKYVIFDLPYLSALQRFYLRTTGLTVRSLGEFKTADDGVICTSDSEELGVLNPDSSGNCDSMAVATWSISETPIHLRSSILPLLSQYGAFLVAYQYQFGEVDNVDFFRRWKESFGKEVAWYGWEIEHMPGSRYLVGRRIGR